MLVKFLTPLLFLALILKSASANEDRLYLNLFARQGGILNSIYEQTISSVHVYQSTEGGTDAYCFWTRNENLLSAFKNAKEEQLGFVGNPLSGRIVIKRDMEYTFPESYSGNLMESGYTPVKSQKTVKAHRACIFLFPDAETKQIELRKYANRSFKSVERINSLIAVLELLEKNPKTYAQELKQVQAMIEQELDGLHAASNEPFAFRKILIEKAKGAEELNAETRSLLAFQLLMNSLITRQSFVPPHRIGEFLSNLNTIHEGVAKAQADLPVVWVRNQLWNDGTRNSFHIEFRTTTKQELCENYFTYSLPIFIHSVLETWRQSGAGGIVSTVGEKQIKSGLIDFKMKSLPHLLQDCPYTESLHFLRTNLDSILTMDLSKKLLKITDQQSKLIEWSLFRPDSPELMPAGHPIVEAYAGKAEPFSEVMVPADYQPAAPGSIRFSVLDSPKLLIDHLSRYGILSYSGNAVCGLFLFPVFGLEMTSGNQFDLASGCTDSTTPRKHADRETEYTFFKLAQIASSETWIPEHSAGLVATQKRGDLEISLTNYSPFRSLKSRHPIFSQVYLLNSAVLQGAAKSISFEEALTRALRP